MYNNDMQNNLKLNVTDPKEVREKLKNETIILREKGKLCTVIFRNKQTNSCGILC